MKAASELASALGGAVKRGDSWYCLCPTHSDHSPSLAITTGEDGKLLLKCRANCPQDALVDELTRRGLWEKQQKPRSARKRSRFRFQAAYDYRDETGAIVYQVVRTEPKGFYQRRPDSSAPRGWANDLDGVEPLPYRLPEFLAQPDAPVLAVEGEKDVDNLLAGGFLATCNHGGAAQTRIWHKIAPWLAGRRVVILPDNDPTGEAHALEAASALAPMAASVHFLTLPGLPPRGDVSDWIAAGGTPEQLIELLESAAQPYEAEPAKQFTNGHLQPEEGEGVELGDFYAYMRMHNYIFAPTRELWPAGSVNSRIEPIPVGNNAAIVASLWLDRNKPVEQMTWAPGLPMIIEDRLISEGGWIERKGVRCFNLYRPPSIKLGGAAQAQPWIDHINKVYPDDAAHIIPWLAHRVQRPQEKINHALVLGGL